MKAVADWEDEREDETTLTKALNELFSDIWWRNTGYVQMTRM